MKKFFDVFPALTLDGKSRDLFEQVEVERISSTKRKDFLRVYIASGRLIEKEQILKTEEAIRKQLFTTFPVEIRIYEKYHLSSMSSQTVRTFFASKSLMALCWVMILCFQFLVLSSLIGSSLCDRNNALSSI